jgi:hypothetical protein
MKIRKTGFEPFWQRFCGFQTCLTQLGQKLEDFCVFRILTRLR